MALNADWIEPDDRLHFQEAADRYARMVEELESVREREALTHEALTDLRAEHMNKQALILAIVALVFLPLTFITGVFTLICGLTLFAAHHHWTSPPAIAITFLALLTMLRGVALLFGAIVAGSLAPIIAVKLLADFGSSVPIAIYLAGACVVTLIALAFARETAGIDLHDLDRADAATR